MSSFFFSIIGCGRAYGCRDGRMVVDGGAGWWMVVDGRKKSSPISLKIGTLVVQNN